MRIVERLENLEKLFGETCSPTPEMELEVEKHFAQVFSECAVLQANGLEPGPEHSWPERGETHHPAISPAMWAEAEQEFLTMREKEVEKLIQQGEEADCLLAEAARNLKARGYPVKWPLED